MATVYATMQPQEELAVLFSRNLTLNPMAQPIPVQASEHKTVYVSQHYNHSAHLARQREQQQQQQQQQDSAQPASRPASEPPQSEHAALEQGLREHGIDPSCLSSAQLQLFKTVDTPEKLRLLELWRACPPTSSADNPMVSTTVDQEETLARMRFEQQLQQQAQEQLEQELLQHQHQHQQQQQQRQQQKREDDQETVMSLDGTPLTPIQAGDGRWIAAPAAGDVEPYMAHGYGYYEEVMLANRRIRGAEPAAGGCCPYGRWRFDEF